VRTSRSYPQATLDIRKKRHTLYIGYGGGREARLSAPAGAIQKHTEGQGTGTLIRRYGSTVAPPRMPTNDDWCASCDSPSESCLCDRAQHDRGWINLAVAFIVACALLWFALGDIAFGVSDIGTVRRDPTSASGYQTITHDLGVVPEVIHLECIYSDHSFGFSVGSGFWDVASSGYVYVANASAYGADGSGSACAVHNGDIPGDGDIAFLSISNVSSSSFRLTWTYDDTAPWGGEEIHVVWLAEAVIASSSGGTTIVNETACGTVASGSACVVSDFTDTNEVLAYLAAAFFAFLILEAVYHVFDMLKHRRNGW